MKQSYIEVFHHKGHFVLVIGSRNEGSHVELSSVDIPDEDLHSVIMLLEKEKERVEAEI